MRSAGYPGSSLVFGRRGRMRLALSLGGNMRDGPFRIEKPAAAAAHAEANPADAFRDYMNRLIVLVPGEALGAYLTIRGFFAGSAGQPVHPFVPYLPVLGLALVLVARIWGTRDAGGASPQPIGIVVAAIAFVLWVLGMGHSFAGLALDGSVASALIIVFSFIVPYFYKGE